MLITLCKQSVTRGNNDVPYLRHSVGVQQEYPKPSIFVALLRSANRLSISFFQFYL